MRSIFGLLGLLLVLAAVGLLLRQQMTTGHTALPASGTVVQPSKQIEQQFKQTLEQAMQPRPQPADTP